VKQPIYNSEYKSSIYWLSGLVNGSCYPERLTWQHYDLPVSYSETQVKPFVNLCWLYVDILDDDHKLITKNMSVAE